MTLYSDHLKAHLASYKQGRLSIVENGRYRGNGRAYGHVLPENLYRLNVIEGIRKEFWQYFDANAAQLGLHTDFHHLNSSQAFGFNLLFPFVSAGGAPNKLLEALGLPVKEIRWWSFEHMPNQAERTSVDFYAELHDGRRVLIEVKLTEASFGAAMPNIPRSRKLAEFYTPNLSGKALAHGLAEGPFFLNYQLFRNVSHLDLGREDVLILLMPRANELTWAQGVAFRENFLETKCQPAVRLVAVEDLVAQLALSVPYRLRTQLEMLSEKYDLLLTGSDRAS